MSKKSPTFGRFNGPELERVLRSLIALHTHATAEEIAPGANLTKRRCGALLWQCYDGGLLLKVGHRKTKGNPALFLVTSTGMGWLREREAGLHERKVVPIAEPVPQSPHVHRILRIAERWREPEINLPADPLLRCCSLRAPGEATEELEEVA
jgi:hypothetical protein